MSLTIKSLLPQDEFPYVQDSSPIITSLGLIKLRSPPPQRDNPCWDQSTFAIRANLSTIWFKFWP